MKFEEFILAHDGDDLASLALARGRYASDVQDFDLALTTLEVRRKLRDKVPEWYDVPALTYPFRLSSEQCSSTATALYKAHVAMAEGTPSAIADLTGGLGVDSWAFSKVFGRVLYNEMRPELAKAADMSYSVKRALKLRAITARTLGIMMGSFTFRKVLTGLDPRFLAASSRSPSTASASSLLQVVHTLFHNSVFSTPKLSSYGK